MTTDHAADPALAFFREVVEPTVMEFLADPADKRRGCLACLAVAGMTEHYFHARPALAAGGEAALKKLKGALRDENKILGWIADVANATKHVERGRHGKRVSVPRLAHAMTVRRASAPPSGSAPIMSRPPSPPVWPYQARSDHPARRW